MLRPTLHGEYCAHGHVAGSASRYVSREALAAFRQHNARSGYILLRRVTSMTERADLRRRLAVRSMAWFGFCSAHFAMSALTKENIASSSHFWLAASNHQERRIPSFLNPAANKASDLVVSSGSIVH